MLRSLCTCLVLLLPLAGCGPTEAPLPDAAPLDALGELERDTGQKWTVRWHKDVHIPAFLEGRTAPLAATANDAERAGRAFLIRYHALFGMRAINDELSVIDSVTDELGMTHARFAQKRGKVPVWGGDLVVHFAEDGALVRVNGRVLPLPTIPLEPSRSPDEARVAAVLHARGARPEVAAEAFVTRTPKLVVYPRSAVDARLAWRVETDVQDAEEPMLLETFIDAEDGSVLAAHDLIDTLGGSGTGVFGDTKMLDVIEKRGSYWLEDAGRGAQKTYSAGGKVRLPGTGVKSEELHRWDTVAPGAGSAVDAHWAVAATYDYFRGVHGRRGWDGRDSAARATVHFGRGYANAFFNGRQLVFGDGDGLNMSPPAAALDIVAHEFTHAVTFHTAGLRHQGETGALNEAISDIFGCFASREAGRTNWQIGDTIYHPGGRPGSLRDLRDPHATGNPKHWSEYVATRDDKGGVHVNAPIVGHAAYLMTEGGPGVAGAGAIVVERIWYRALVHYLTSNATFADAADATLAAARDLHKGERAVREAWIAVGVASE
jgi:bacillolysin